MSYFEDGEALKERSIQEACEHLEVKPDAKRANTARIKSFKLSYFEDGEVRETAVYK